jgi:hypothetical protein
MEAILVFLLSCSPEPRPTATYDINGDGHVDEWVYTVSKSEIKIALDTNHDGRPDVVEKLLIGVKVDWTG